MSFYNRVVSYWVSKIIQNYSGFVLLQFYCWSPKKIFKKSNKQKNTHIILLTNKMQSLYQSLSKLIKAFQSLYQSLYQCKFFSVGSPWSFHQKFQLNHWIEVMNHSSAEIASILFYSDFTVSLKIKLKKKKNSLFPLFINEMRSLLQ